MGNVPGYNLTGSINKPNVNGKMPNIDINKPSISGKIPGIEGNIGGSNIKVSSPIPDLDINIKGPNFGYDKTSLTLKKICDGDINDDINLNIKNPKIRGYNNYNISGVIDGKLSTGNIDINGPNINLPEFNLGGNINKQSINGKIPNVNVNINKPNIDISGKIPKINLDMNGPNIKNNSNITLKEIFGGDIDDDINLNRYKLKINTNLPNEKMTGIIDPSLLPSTNIDINGPNINIPQVNLRVKKPELNASGKIPGLNISVKKPKIDIDGDIPGVNINININQADIKFNPSDMNNKTILNNIKEIKTISVHAGDSISASKKNINIPNINLRYKDNIIENYNKNSKDANLRGKFISINRNSNKSSINSNYKYNSTITLREIFGGDINENVILISKKIEPNNNDEVYEGYIPSNQINNYMNFNADENMEETNGLDFNVPNINLNPYKTITNSSVKESNIDENNRKTLQAIISERINVNKSKKSNYKRIFNNVRISSNSNGALNYRLKNKVNNKNPLKQSNMPNNNNLRKAKQIVNGDSITLRELFNGDIDDIVTITKNEINVNSKENLEEIEDNFDLPNLDDVKSLNEIVSDYKARHSINKNTENFGKNTFNNNDSNIDGINGLID